MKISTKKPEVKVINKEKKQKNIKDKNGHKLKQINRFI